MVEAVRFEAPPVVQAEKRDEIQLAKCCSLENLSLGGAAAMIPQLKLPKKYRRQQPGEVSTFQGAGVVPATRLPNGEVRILLWQPQAGRKKGVRWYDFGGRKKESQEFTSVCACRKFAKETYGLFGCNLEMDGEVSTHLKELYQGLANLPLMLRASQEWALLQLTETEARIYYNDIHEYHTYMLCVPYVEAELLNQVSQIVDGGKRKFRWMTVAELKKEVMAPRLHTASLEDQLDLLQDDPWVTRSDAYGDAVSKPATGCFSASVVGG